MPRLALLANGSQKRLSMAEVHVIVKLLRSSDWLSRHLFFTMIRSAHYHKKVVKKIERLMGPDELLYGKNEGCVVSECVVIPLHDKSRQMTLHRFFRSAEQIRKGVAKKPMRQLTLSTYFKKG